MAGPLLEVEGLAKQFDVGGAWIARRRRVIRAVDGVTFDPKADLEAYAKGFAVNNVKG
jgi:ABC-type oligopeptide transport system ATPase subunit